MLETWKRSIHRPEKAGIMAHFPFHDPSAGKSIKTPDEGSPHEMVDQASHITNRWTSPPNSHIRVTIRSAGTGNLNFDSGREVNSMLCAKVWMTSSVVGHAILAYICESQNLFERRMPEQKE